jgi:hypothetical protein
MRRVGPRACRIEARTTRPETHLLHSSVDEDGAGAGREARTRVRVPAAVPARAKKKGKVHKAVRSFSHLVDTIMYCGETHSVCSSLELRHWGKLWGVPLIVVQREGRRHPTGSIAPHGRCTCVVAFGGRWAPPVGCPPKFRCVDVRSCVGNERIEEGRR